MHDRANVRSASARCVCFDSYSSMNLKSIITTTIAQQCHSKIKTLHALSFVRMTKIAKLFMPVLTNLLVAEVQNNNNSCIETYLGDWSQIDEDQFKSVWFFSSANSILVVTVGHRKKNKTFFS